jgi:hypothetical protein
VFVSSTEGWEGEGRVNREEKKRERVRMRRGGDEMTGNRAGRDGMGWKGVGMRSAEGLEAKRNSAFPLRPAPSGEGKGRGRRVEGGEGEGGVVGKARQRGGNNTTHECPP